MHSRSSRDNKLPSCGTRIICYHQEHYLADGTFIPALPLLERGTGVTHVIFAALHLNHPDIAPLTLNDDAWDSERAARVWEDASRLQSGGVQVLAMLGGADHGSFAPLDGDYPTFAKHYAVLQSMICATGIDGLDLCVEEEMSLAGIVRLIDHLRTDFGQEFLVTLAPVGPALRGGEQLSGFDYMELEKAMGSKIDWYNVQFYCGWGSLQDTHAYEAIIEQGWDPSRVVAGTVTNPKICRGWVCDTVIRSTLHALQKKYPRFGGVMGWEYTFSITSAHPCEGKPWLWAELMTHILRTKS